MRTKVFLLSMVVLTVAMPAQARDHGSSVTYGNTTVYQDGTVANRHKNITNYSTGEVDIQFKDITIHHPAPQNTMEMPAMRGIGEQDNNHNGNRRDNYNR
jgi:hypothetical protein